MTPHRLDQVKPQPDDTFRIALTPSMSVDSVRSVVAEQLAPHTLSERRRRSANWQLLVDPKDRVGADRLFSQVIRANVEPSDLYVQSRKGNSRYRLRPEQSNFDNLVLADD